MAKNTNPWIRLNVNSSPELAASLDARSAAWAKVKASKEYKAFQKAHEASCDIVREAKGECNVSIKPWGVSYQVATARAAKAEMEDL